MKGLNVLQQQARHAQIQLESLRPAHALEASFAVDRPCVSRLWCQSQHQPINQCYICSNEIRREFVPGIHRKSLVWLILTHMLLAVCTMVTCMLFGKVRLYRCAPVLTMMFRCSRGSSCCWSVRMTCCAPRAAAVNPTTPVPAPSSITRCPDTQHLSAHITQSIPCCFACRLG
jgi:hypothetical protein